MTGWPDLGPIAAAGILIVADHGGQIHSERPGRRFPHIAVISEVFPRLFGNTLK